jgi:hypothetical protein
MDEKDETDETTTDYYQVEHNYADSDEGLIDELESLTKKLSKIILTIPEVSNKKRYNSAKVRESRIREIKFH